jgi:large subunit ribosomal protein L3
MSKGIIGKKIGMTQIFVDGKAVPVTVVEAGPCFVTQKKTIENDGYNAIQVGFQDKKDKNVNKPLQGHFAKAGLKPFQYLTEFRAENNQEFTVGQEIKVDIFTDGEVIDVTGISKGKGFAGGIKRHGFHRGPMKHGSKYHRRPGSLGAKGPARVFKGRKLPGHAGKEKVTVQNLPIVRVDADRNLLLVKGAIPGPRKGFLVIKSAAKAK